MERRTPRITRTHMTRAIQDELMALILERGLGPGDPLPTESELVEELGVSRNSLREALKALQALDIVVIRHGYGTHVGTLSLDPLADGLTFRAMQGFSGGVPAIQEILEVREALEDGLIRKVAAEIPEADLEALAEAVKAMDARAKQGEDFAEEDRRFHELLYRSLDNEVVIQLLRAFWNVFHRVNDRLGGVDPDPVETVRKHRAILNALRRRDVTRAQKAMADHFRNIDSRVEKFAERHRRTTT